ncbi:hypothetical protein [Iamia sp.]|nr:hypothetical protein [Iamia sp.]HXH55981.1 hypothetical protein [Iamia sp.]
MARSHPPAPPGTDRARRPSRRARDDGHAAWLWDESEAMLASVGAGL